MTPFYHVFYDGREYSYIPLVSNHLGEYLPNNGHYCFAVFTRSIDAMRYCSRENRK